MTRIIRLTAFGLCAVAVFAAVDEAAEQEAANSKPADRDPLICITPKRLEMAAKVRTLCFAPHRLGPHGDPAEILIYANKIALDYRREHPQAFDYPLGSKFVKEKFAKTGDEQPDAATVMEKKATKGKVSDWNFSTISLPDKTVQKSADKNSCVTCHQEYKETGYVSDESESALKQYLKVKE